MPHLLPSSDYDLIKLIIPSLVVADNAVSEAAGIFLGVFFHGIHKTSPYNRLLTVICHTII